MRTRAFSRGFTLVELMITVSIIGVLAAIATFGISKYMHVANASEAKLVVGSVSRAAALAYEGERAASQIVGEGSNSSAASTVLCEAALPVPAAVTQVAGRKYQPNTTTGSDFETGSPVTGWRCLRFATAQPIYYQYQYNKGAGYVTAGMPGAPVLTANSFEAAALGDLDGDGLKSTFARGGTINLTTGALTMATHVFIDKETE